MHNISSISAGTASIFYVPVYMASVLWLALSSFSKYVLDACNVLGAEGQQRINAQPESVNYIR